MDLPATAASPPGTPPGARLPAAIVAALHAAVGEEGEVRLDEPMSRHTTLRIGGPADAWVEPAGVAAAQAVRALCALHKIPCRAVGAGSNLLVRDGGVRGVLLSSERLRRLEFSTAGDDPTADPSSAIADSTADPRSAVADSTAASRSAAAGSAADPRSAVAAQAATRVIVGAGVSTGKLLSEATRRGLGGVEFLGGVPGSVGGGLMMNAGTYLGEFTSVATRVRSVDERGLVVERDHRACGFVYRGSAIPPDEMIVEGELLLLPRPRAEIEADVRALRDRRRAREPHGLPNAGSIFKNPPGDFAGRLIEALGYKGRRTGDAEVSTAHANWIVNRGAARAGEVLSLCDEIRAAVSARFGVTLELEVKVVGEP